MFKRKAMNGRTNYIGLVLLTCMSLTVKNAMCSYLIADFSSGGEMI